MHDAKITLIIKNYPVHLYLLVSHITNHSADGLALGASFSSGKGLALATTISVFFHEVPHEIGDFSILIESGFSKYQAIVAQFYTAVAAIFGTLVGLCAQRNETFEKSLLAFTCGGFLYVATVGIIPMMSIERAEKDELFKAARCTQLALEAIGFCLGVSMMVAVAFFEELFE